MSRHKNISSTIRSQGAVVELIQEQLTEIFECLPEDNTEWWVKEIEERIAKVEALLSNYQETLE